MTAGDPEMDNPGEAEGVAADAAKLLQQLLDAVEDGQLDAPPGFTTRLEGVLIALRAMSGR